MKEIYVFLILWVIFFLALCGFVWLSGFEVFATRSPATAYFTFVGVLASTFLSVSFTQPVMELFRG